jgi:hypothetical protein
MNLTNNNNNLPSPSTTLLLSRSPPPSSRLPCLPHAQGSGESRPPDQHPRASEHQRDVELSFVFAGHHDAQKAPGAGALADALMR